MSIVRYLFCKKFHVPSSSSSFLSPSSYKVQNYPFSKYFSTQFINQHAQQQNSSIIYPQHQHTSSIDANNKNYKKFYGQPTPYTHPHLLQPHEICMGIKKTEFQLRRKLLMENIYKYAINTKSTLKNHIVIIPSSTKKYMSDKIPYVFRQNSDFLYLTGCLEPDTILILTVNDKELIKTILLMRPNDKNAELWDGPRTGIENSVEYFGVDEAYNIDVFKNLLYGYLHKNESAVVWYDFKSSDLHKYSDIIKNFTKDKNVNIIESPTIFIHKLRLIKSLSEIELMKFTCKIASECINETINETKPGDSEHHVFARIDFKCRMRNASHLAYPPVVASGHNATIIHYINNTQLINDGDLILMDAGCEYGGYSSDITRTWPANGNFTEYQRILYEVVLTVQKELIDTLLKNGGKTLDELFDTMCLKLGKYLREIGLLPNSLSQLELAKAAYTFCPHHVSHYLGMDVHDTPLISRSTKLIPGMVCTVEPGIYIASDRQDVPPEFRGIGIRVEDDILIKSNESIQILTDMCYKETNDIENLFLNKIK